MSKHTPGPWAVDRSLSAQVRVYAPAFEDKTDAETICIVPAAFREIQAANAALIAAAPDMHFAIRRAIDEFGETGAITKDTALALQAALPKEGK